MAGGALYELVDRLGALRRARRPRASEGAARLLDGLRVVSDDGIEVIIRLHAGGHLPGAVLRIADALLFAWVAAYYVIAAFGQL